MGIKAIRQELESMGIGTKSFIEKSEIDVCCADYCGKEEGGSVSLKACKSCMLVELKRKSHKQICKQRVAELRDEALFKDPPAKEDCPICFLPMPEKLLSCMMLPPATILSVPIFYFAMANEELANMSTET
jgi:hypothetical protein